MPDAHNYTVEELVSAYVKIRDKKAELKAQFMEQQRPYDEALRKIEVEMLDKLRTAGVESMKTAAGTAYKSIRSSVVVADRAAFLDFIVEGATEAIRNGADATSAFDYLDIKANKTAVEDHLSQTNELPPGVDIRREEVVGFRRA